MTLFQVDEIKGTVADAEVCTNTDAYHNPSALALVTVAGLVGRIFGSVRGILRRVAWGRIVGLVRRILWLVWLIVRGLGRIFRLVGRISRGRLRIVSRNAGVRHGTR